MGSFLRSRWVLGAGLVVAIAAVSASAFVYQGRGGSTDAATTVAPSTRAAASTTSTTSTTTTTAPPAPVAEAPAPAPAPAPAAAPAPAPAPAPPAPAAATPACDGGGSAIIDAMNGDRGAAGLGGLCASSALNGYAQAWANWMAQNQTMVHQDLNNVLSGTSFNTLGENLLQGPGGMSVGSMESAWMGSPGHRANILNGAFYAAGVGIASSSDGRVWICVDFGG